MGCYVTTSLGFKCVCKDTQRQVFLGVVVCGGGGGKQDRGVLDTARQAKTRHCVCRPLCSGVGDGAAVEQRRKVKPKVGSKCMSKCEGVTTRVGVTVTTSAGEGGGEGEEGSEEATRWCTAVLKFQ